MTKKKFFSSMPKGTKPQPKPTASQILENVEKRATEEELEEGIRKEVKELLNEPVKPAKPGGAGSKFGRAQRNIPTADPTKTVYDPNFAKPRAMPTPNKSTQIAPPLSKRPTVVMPGGTAKTQIRPNASTRPQISPPRPLAKTIRPSSPEGLERVAQRIPEKVVKEAREVAGKVAQKAKPGKGIGIRLKARSLLKNVGKIVAVGAIASVIGFAILDHLGVAVFEHAADEALRKMGLEADLSAYLPNGTNKVIWSDASYIRYSREEVGSDSLPNVLVDEITIYPPQNNILVMGISLEGLPDFVGDININELGNGNSDWLCEKYGGFLICRSMSGAHPLNAKLKSVVTMQYHLPGYELKEMLATGGGNRSVYFIVK